MTEQEGRDRLAAAVRADRLRIYGTVEKARAGVAVSRGSWDAVERGKPVREFTLAAVEKALDWPAGRSAQLLGAEPEDDAEAQIRAMKLPSEAEAKILAVLEADRAARQQDRGSA